MKYSLISTEIFIRYVPNTNIISYYFTSIGQTILFYYNIVTYIYIGKQATCAYNTLSLLQPNLYIAATYSIKVYYIVISSIIRGYILRVPLSK